jgi:hypothetical protein
MESKPVLSYEPRPPPNRISRVAFWLIIAACVIFALFVAKEALWLWIHRNDPEFYE